MKSKGHLCTSLIKSLIRISGCILALQYNNLSIALWSLAIAELLDIVEELVDFR